MELLGIFPLERRKFINEFVSSPNHTADIINQTNLHSGQIRYRNSPLPAKRNNVFYKKEKDFTITIKEKASAESKDLMFRVERSRAALSAVFFVWILQQQKRGASFCSFGMWCIQVTSHFCAPNFWRGCGILTIGRKWLDSGREAFMWLEPQRIWPLALAFMWLKPQRIWLIAQTSYCPKM